jgi:hypothetical protein
MPPIVLIMTATIRPPLDAPGVHRLDPAVRLADYEAALSFYLDHLGAGLDVICFAENSGSGLASLRAMAATRGAASRTIFTEQSGLEFPPVYGRCYGETALLERAMSDSAVASFPEDTIFWKVTGRYKVLNLRQMIRSRPVAADFYADLRTRRSERWADLRLMSWNRRGFEHAMRGIAPLLREDMNSRRPGEEAAFDVLRDRVAAGGFRAVTSFTTEPLIDGVRAFDQKNWMQGRQRAVYLARSLQRALFRRVII